MRAFISCMALISLFLMASSKMRADASTEITYQGHLAADGAAYSGIADFEVMLFDGPEGEAKQVGSTLSIDDISVADGLFTLTLDFGAEAFPGAERWLEIRVNAPGNGGRGPYTTLTPRQQLTPSPYSIHSQSVSLVGDSALSGTYSDELAFTNRANVFNGEFIGDGSGLTNLDAGSLASGTVDQARFPVSVLNGLPVGSSMELLLRSATETPIGPASIALLGDRAFVVNSGANLLMVYDVSNPANPTQVGSAFTGNFPAFVAVDESHAYVKSNNDLEVFEISEFGNPSLVGSLPIGQATIDMAKAGDYVYILEFEFARLLMIYDVSNPASPTQAGFAVLDDFPRCVAVSGNFAYVSSNNREEVYDVSDPSNVTRVYEASGPSLQSISARIADNHLYLLRQNSIQAFSLANPALPSFIGQAFFSGGFPIDISVSGSSAYVVSRSPDRLRAFDTSDPANMLQTHTIDLGSEPTSVAASESQANVINRFSDTLHIFAMTDASVYDLAIKSDEGFVGNGAGLTNLNASNINHGSLNISRLPVGGNWSLSSLLNIASNTLVANPANSRVGISTNSPDSRLHVAAGSTATLTTGSGFLQVGPTNGANLVMDGGRILARNNGSTGLMRIQTTGVRVGSGTDPFATLHVESSSDAVLGAGFRVRFDGTTTVLSTTNGGTSLGSSVTAPNNGLRVAGESFLLGNVGISTSVPGSFQLAVNGNAAKTGGGSWSVFSDERLKHDIEPLAAGVLDRVLSLNGYTFQYNEEAVEKKFASPGTQTGLLAQEVAEVFPGWVDADDEGYLYVTERGTTALFVEAMRELRAEKDAEIAALNERISLLEDMVLRTVSRQQLHP